MIASVWGRELVEFTRHRKALVIKLVYPLVVGLPILFGGAPRFYAAIVLTMLVTTLSALGTGAVLARERAAGMQRRYRLLPRPASILLVERLAASAMIDAVQFLPVLVLVTLRNPAGWRWWAAVALCVAGVLVVGNALGALASTFTAAPGEVMLYVFIPLMPAFYLAGLFVPARGEPAVLVSRLLPFGYLRDALTGALGGSPPLHPAQAALAGVAMIAAGGLAAAAMGRRVMEAA
jgi:hypothetical protein